MCIKNFSRKRNEKNFKMSHPDMILELNIKPKLKYPGKCPMTMRKNWRKYMAMVSQGKAVTLQDEKSDVSLKVPDGVHAVLQGCVHTDHSRFVHAIPREECIVSPMVEFHLLSSLVPEETEPKHQYTIRIPHCVPEEAHWKYIKVRSGDIHGDSEFTEIKRFDGKKIQGTCYQIDKRFITITTTHFTDFTCTLCENSCCPNLAMLFLFGSIKHNVQRKTQLEIQPFLCSFLYIITDYREVCQETHTHTHTHKFPLHY